MAKSVASYKSDDGQLFDNLPDAVSHELQVEMDSWFAAPLTESRHIARYLQDPARRQRFRKIMDQF